MVGGVEIHLLGPVEAREDGHALPVGGRRQRALLALLSLTPGRPVPADRLADELWSGRPPAGAETTLRSYVSRLRRALGADAVRGEGGGYVLAVEHEEVDAHRFERLAAQGREELARGAAGRASERLGAALALWRGRALADVAEGGALAAEALRLDELRLVCVEERIEAELALGRQASLVPELQALVRAEPLREPFRRQLVLALYRCGRQADALAAYREARETLDAELGLEPGEELRRLEVAILRQEVEPVAPAAVRHNLPAPATSFVGRERELEDLERLLREHRLVTLTGMGGSGKTRLALEVAGRQAQAWTDGVWLVDLTALADPELVPGAVADALGVDEGPSGLLAHARGLELLLLLDNCEHVVATCAELVEELLRGAPHVRVLATSRVPLGAAGEVDYALDPLPEEPSVRLFLDRAAAVRRDLPGDGDALATVTGICRELDGLPLAIELAAARAKALSPAEIAARLDDRFRFLRAWKRVADPRHRTLQETMDWSYELLGPEERELLVRLSVFAGGAELDSVAAVCLDDDEDAAVDLLTRLVDASLVRADAGERTRYRLLETVRQYAAAKLAEDPVAGDVHRRHAEHYLRLAEEANLGLESLGRGPQRHAPVLREQHNLRAALDWTAAADVELGLRLLLSLENFWVTQALTEGRRRFEQHLARADGVDLVLQARSWRDCAACSDVLGEFEAARDAYVRSRELFVEAGDRHAVAYLDYRLGIAVAHLGDPVEARRLWQRSLEVFRREGDTIGELQTVGSLGSLALREGDLERGCELTRAAIATAAGIGWHWWELSHRMNIADALVNAGRADEAEPEARASLPLALQIGSRQYLLYVLAVLARCAAARGDDELALTLWASVEPVEDAPGRFGRFDREAYAAAMPAGPRPTPLPLDEAAALALAG